MSDTTLSVTGLTHLIHDTLRSDFGQVHVVGEIATRSFPRSGHWYFSVQDAGATLPCVMFRGDNQRVSRPIEVGEQVVVTGGLDVYPPRGAYQLIARRLVRVGEGDRAAKLEALKRKLFEEGLLSPERKRPLPPLPRVIGIATSATGAAVRDIIEVVSQRFPAVTMVISPCLVQGPSAPQQIVRALERLAEWGGCDVIIVARGGGSAEDLYAFDEEMVARAVAAMPVPVISAVGHEIDVSICDLVADVRAATPSHAGELVVPEQEALLFALDDLDTRARRALGTLVQRRREALGRIRLRSPQDKLAEARRRVEELTRRNREAVRYDLERRHRRLSAASGRLEALSPLAVLERGYAVALLDGKAVTDVAQLTPGDLLRLRLARGEAAVRVEGAGEG